MNMTRNRAYELGQTIRSYWQKHGCVVNIEIVREKWIEGTETPGWTVRSDMRNGLPRDATPATLKSLEFEARQW